MRISDFSSVDDLKEVSVSSKTVEAQSHSQPAAQKCLVPKGHPRIAQRFSVGIAGNSEPMSPEGTTETRATSAVPSGRK